MSSSRYAARYIGRYIARPALAEHKITSYDGQWVTFWYESHEEKRRVYRRLEAREFIERLIDHIPLKGFKMVRHYGLYARRSKGIALEILRKCRNFLQQSFAFLRAPAKVLGCRPLAKTPCSVLVVGRRWSFGGSGIRGMGIYLIGVETVLEWSCSMRKIQRKKKPGSSWKVHDGRVSYRCSQCNTHEDIPADVLNFFDVIDPGDPSVPPRFRCQKCGGVMLPV